MKKIFFIIFAIIALLLISGCDDNSVNPTVNPPITNDSLLVQKDSCTIWNTGYNCDGLNYFLNQCNFSEIRMKFECSTNDSSNYGNLTAYVSSDTSMIFYFIKLGWERNCTIDTTVSLANYQNFSLFMQTSICFPNEYGGGGAWIKLKNIKFYKVN